MILNDLLQTVHCSKESVDIPFEIAFNIHFDSSQSVEESEGLYKQALIKALDLVFNTLVSEINTSIIHLDRMLDNDIKYYILPSLEDAETVALNQSAARYLGGQILALGRREYNERVAGILYLSGDDDSSWGNLATLYLSDIELTEGSLKGLAKGFGVVTFSAATAIGASAGLGITNESIGEQINQVRNEYVINQSIEAHRCHTHLHYRFNLSELKKKGSSLMDVNKDGISEEERDLRICTSQSILNFINRSVGEVDGIIGPKTTNAYERFANDRGYDSSNVWSNEELRTELFSTFLSEIRQRP